MTKRIFEIYRYDPDKDAKPYMQSIEVELDGHERMLLDALMKLKKWIPLCHSDAHAVKVFAALTP